MTTETLAAIEQRTEAAEIETIGGATYSPEDNKLRLYPFSRLDAALYERVKAAGFGWAPRQKLFVAGRWTPSRFDLLVELCGEVGDEDTSLAERAEDRAERFQGYKRNRTKDAEQAHDAVSAIADNIPLGQPILVGHHSEKHARKDQERIERGMRKSIQMWDTAKYWERRAEGAVRHAKYTELPAVRARRIKKIETDRRRVLRGYTPANPDQTITREPFYCLICGKYSCKIHPEAKEQVPHVYCGDGRGGSWVPVQSLPAIERAGARWLAHYDNRLTYEKAMLADQGASELLDKPKRAKLPPILNYRAPEGFTVPSQYHRGETRHFPQYEITKADYAKAPKDNRGTRTTADGSHRFKICIGHYVPAYMAQPAADDTARMNRKHSYVAVFITDSKEHAKPEPEVIEAEDISETEQGKAIAEDIRPTYQEPSPAPSQEDSAPTMGESIEAMKETLRNGGVKVISAPQLFPTPPEIALGMAKLLNVCPGQMVLEPSAGTGSLIDALGTIFPPILDEWRHNLRIVELNYELAGALAAKYRGTAVSVGDFLEKTSWELGGPFDRIIMNPPFSKGQDIKHIQHAIEMLAPGGRLVALCANGPRQNDTLRPLADTWEVLPAGSFKSQGTGVSVAMMTYIARGE